MRALYETLGITANPSTVYHPQTDGQTERVNQELEEYLRMYINDKQKDWVEWLPIAQFCHNDRIHSATGFSPFYMNNGRHPYKGITEPKDIKNATAEKYITIIKETHEKAKINLEKAAQNMKKQYDK
jgi:hypothetical protein